MYVAEHHSKELTEKLLKYWEQECKSTETRAKDEFEKKVEWLKKTGWLKKHMRNHKISHMKETMNIKWKKEEIPGKIKPKTKLNEKETWNDQLKRPQDQCSTKDIESAPSDDTLVKTLDAISNNNFDKHLENNVIKNSSTTDQQSHHFLSENPSH